MGLEVRLSGGVKLKAAAAQIKAVGNKSLGRRMSRALHEATLPLEAAVRAEASTVMPHGGGYADVLSKSLRFRTMVRAGAATASVRFRTYADGTKQRRDVGALDKGSLRHPVFGRSRRVRVGNRAGTALPNPWAVTRIAPGFHSRPTASAADLAEAQMQTVLQEVLDQLKG